MLCVVESVNYGKSFIGKGSSTATRYQTVRDDMGMEVLMLLLGMVVIAFAVWGYMVRGLNSGYQAQIRACYQICAVIVGCLGLWFAFPVKEASAENKIEWAVWSPELEAKLEKEGKLSMWIILRDGVHPVSQINGSIILIPLSSF